MLGKVERNLKDMNIESWVLIRERLSGEYEEANLINIWSYIIWVMSKCTTNKTKWRWLPWKSRGNNLVQIWYPGCIMWLLAWQINWMDNNSRPLVVKRPKRQDNLMVEIPISIVLLLDVLKWFHPSMLEWWPWSS